MRFKFLATSALMLLVSHASTAAELGAGTLSLGELTLNFTNEVPAVGLNLTSDPARACLDPLLPCDQYALTIALPDDMTDYFPDAQVRILLNTTGPTSQDDLDLYLLDADGNEIAASGNFQTPESIGFLANNGEENYTVEVQYYIALGTTYNLDIELSLGEPDLAWTEEELAMWLADNGGTASRAGEIPATCADPGVTMLTDAVGDGGLALLPVPGTDLQQLDVFQTTDDDGLPLIALRLTVDDLSSPIPQSVYFVSFKTTFADVRGVRMEIDNQGGITYWSYVVSEDNDGEREGHFVAAGTAMPTHPMTNHTDDGVITFYVSPSALQLTLPGDVLTGFNAGATTFVGAEGAGLSFNNDAMPDGLERQGQFEYLSAEECLGLDRPAEEAAARSLGGSRGGALGWMMLALGLLGLSRRR